MISIHTSALAEIISIHTNTPEKLIVQPHMRLPMSAGAGLTENTTDMSKSLTKDFFALTDDEMELFLKVTRAFKAAENRSGLLQSQHGNISERYQPGALPIT